MKRQTIYGVELASRFQRLWGESVNQEGRASDLDWNPFAASSQTVWPRCATKSSWACFLCVNKCDSSIWPIGLCGFDKTWAKYLPGVHEDPGMKSIVPLLCPSNGRQAALTEPLLYTLVPACTRCLKSSCESNAVIWFSEMSHTNSPWWRWSVSPGLFLSKAGHDAFSHLRNKFNWFEECWPPSLWNFLKKLDSCCQPPERQVTNCYYDWSWTSGQ